MRKDSEQMHQRLSDMAEQRSFLCEQLKALLKRNKVLDSEIDQLKEGLMGKDFQSIATASESDLHSQSLNRSTAHSTATHKKQQHGKQLFKSNTVYQNAMTSMMASSSSPSFKLHNHNNSHSHHNNNHHHDHRNNNHTSDQHGKDSILSNMKSNPQLYRDKSEWELALLDDDEEEEEEVAEKEHHHSHSHTDEAELDRERNNGSSSGFRYDMAKYNTATLQLNSPPDKLLRRQSSNRLVTLPRTSSAATMTTAGISSVDNATGNAIGVTKAMSGLQTGVSSNNLLMTADSRSPSRSMLTGTNSATNNIKTSSNATSVNPNSINNNNINVINSSSNNNLLATINNVRSTLPKVTATRSSTQSPPVSPLRPGRAGGVGAAGVGVGVVGTGPGPAGDVLTMTKRQRRAMYREQVQASKEQRNQWEIELEQSIRTIFEGVQLRKRSGTNLCSTNSRHNSRSPSPPAGGFVYSSKTNEYPSKRLKDGDRLVRRTPHIKRRGGISGLGTEQFSENDRFAAMVKFLSLPDVFAKVVQSLNEQYFPLGTTTVVSEAIPLPSANNFVIEGV
jgi:hypothetical protein